VVTKLNPFHPTCRSKATWVTRYFIDEPIAVKLFLSFFSPSGECDVAVDGARSCNDNSEITSFNPSFLEYIKSSGKQVKGS
jgi:hypothetical protein